MKGDYKDGGLLRTGHFLGLKFDDGWWFVQVLATSELELKPWQLLNSNGNRAELAANTEGNIDDVADENGRLLLEPNDSERDLIFQVQLGIAPSRIQLFPQFGRDQNLGLETEITPGEDEVWATGYDSPYNSPTSQAEVFYINNMSRLGLVGYNPNDEPLPAKLSIHINKIHYATVTDINLMKAMLQNQVTAKKHPMGLGATDRYQIGLPEWVERAFGEHVYETNTILAEGDTSQVENSLSLQDNTALQQPDNIGGGQ